MYLNKITIITMIISNNLQNYIWINKPNNLGVIKFIPFKPI